ncbi:MAG: ABC transporter ATP-binding protein [bacterium]
MDILKTLYKYIKPYKWSFLLATFGRATSDLANLYPAIAYSQLITILSSSTIDNHAIIIAMIIWGLATYWYRIGHDIAKLFGFKVAQYAAIDARFDTLQHLYDLDLSWHETMNAGNKIKRIDNGGDGIKKIIENFFIIIIEATINSLGVIIIFARFDKKISLLLLVFMIIYFIIAISTANKVSESYKKISATEEKNEGLVFESINNIITLKSLNIKDNLALIIKATINDLKRYIWRFLFINRLRNHVLDMITRVFDFGITIYIIISIENKLVGVAVLILFRSLFWKVIEAIAELAEFYNDFAISSVYIKKLNGLKELKSEISGDLKFPTNWQELSVNNINFHYAETSIFHDLNLTIKRSTKLGIVGISGAGKSTLFKLFLDLYENYSGEINFDKISLKAINRASYIHNVSVVLQDTELFNDTLRNNILITAASDQAVSESRIAKSIEIAQLQSVIAKLPHGENTIIGEKGIKLSGGERQRLGIARAVLRNPQILLLDEASSHLDANLEGAMHQALLDNMQQATIIVIAHRLATIKNLDRIIVMDQGKIIEDGNFNELLELKGEFYKLWEKQKLERE